MEHVYNPNSLKLNFIITTFHLQEFSEAFFQQLAIDSFADIRIFCHSQNLYALKILRCAIIIIQLNLPLL